MLFFEIWIYFGIVCFFKLMKRVWVLGLERFKFLLEKLLRFCYLLVCGYGCENFFFSFICEIN